MQLCFRVRGTISWGIRSFLALDNLRPRSIVVSLASRKGSLGVIFFFVIAGWYVSFAFGANENFVVCNELVLSAAADGEHRKSHDEYGW